MRIAIDVQAAAGQPTGIGTYASNLVEALRRLAPHHDYLALDWERNPVMRLDRRLRWQQFELPRRARAARPDLLHVPGFDAPRFKPCPVVLTVHDLIGRLFPATFPPAARLYWAHWLPWSIRWADAVIVDSARTRDDVLRLTPAVPERLHVVPAGVSAVYRPPADPAAARSRVARECGIDGPFLLFVGTLEPRKGLDTLVDAFADLASRHPHALVVAGQTGWGTGALFDRIRALGLQGRIRFVGYVPDSALADLYGTAAAFVFPSRYEGFGLPPLEAMACGAPVVCSTAASLPEVVGDAAVLVAPDDAAALAGAVEQVLASADLRQDLRSRGLRRAAAFSWDETARRTLAVYEHLFDQREGG